MNTHQIAMGLLVISGILVVGGLVLAFTGNEGPEWVAKTIAIIVGALIGLAGSQIIHQEH
jgi:hypothetical protein